MQFISGGHRLPRGHARHAGRRRLRPVRWAEEVRQISDRQIRKRADDRETRGEDFGAKARLRGAQQAKGEEGAGGVRGHAQESKVVGEERTLKMKLLFCFRFCFEFFFCWTKFLVDFFFPSFFSTSNPSKLFRRINVFLLNPILTNIFWLTTCTINQLLASGDLTGCSRGVLTNAWPSCKSVQRATFKIYSTNAIFKYLLTYLNLMCLL